MKKLIAIIAALVIVFTAGCSAPVIDTVVLADTETGSVSPDITVSKVSNIANTAGLKEVSYIGFDKNGSLYATDGSGRLFRWDKEFKDYEHIDIPGIIESADVAALGKYILVETLKSGRYEVLLYSADNMARSVTVGTYSASERTAAPEWKGGAAYACYVTQEHPGYVLNTYNGTETTAMRVNENMLSGYRAANMIRGYILEDAFYIGSDWVAIKVTFNLRTYYAVAELVDGSISHVMILESAGGAAVPTYSGMYYIDKQGTLMFYDAVNRVNEERAADVKCFDAAANGGFTAYVQKEGSTEELYIMHNNGTQRTLVDVNNGIESLDISDDGRYLLVRSRDADAPATVYTLEY